MIPPDLHAQLQLQLSAAVFPSEPSTGLPVPLGPGPDRGPDSRERFTFTAMLTSLKMVPMRHSVPITDPFRPLSPHPARWSAAEASGCSFQGKSMAIKSAV